MELLPKVNVLLLRSDGFWVAVGVEHFLSGRGDTVREALAGFLDDLADQLLIDTECGIPLLGDTPEAPKEYQERYRASDIHLSLDLEHLGVWPAREILGDLRLSG